MICLLLTAVLVHSLGITDAGAGGYGSQGTGTGSGTGSGTGAGTGSGVGSGAGHQKGAEYDQSGGQVDDRSAMQKIKDKLTPGSDVGKHTKA